MTFRYSLNQFMEISMSGEVGYIKARAESLNHCNQYLLHYKSADGLIRECWFDEDEISNIEQE